MAEREGTIQKGVLIKGDLGTYRGKHQLCHWDNLVWFKYATPKILFILWMALKGRLATGDRMRYWDGNTNLACVLCNEPLGTLEHLFFVFLLCSGLGRFDEGYLQGSIHSEMGSVIENYERFDKRIRCSYLSLSPCFKRLFT
ncbi:Reverse transcriptase zinc-binding domain protein [Raphanus sativus]|nr:Reverse transcriptase zinc-binding domain protein [Raphanus sativus]